MLADGTVHKLFSKLADPLVLFGLTGQCVFMMRFVWQWYVSERMGRSHVPLGFWYLSLAGGVMLMIYGILDLDLVIILGQSLGLGIYVRNLVLIYRERARITGVTGAEKKMEGLAVAREKPSI
ncbi:MAG: lipid-A-disaccharide synthase N-terminal domain-containing protein [Planctomycetes bacterium]|nr:lipid-A-disaccharide synthase N-terminal domain-containing protein [Planctomycetota bacterium]